MAGALSEQRAAVGSTVRVGDVVGQVAAGAAAKAEPAPAKAAPAPAPAAPAAAAPAPAPAKAAPAPAPAKAAPPPAPAAVAAAPAPARPSGPSLDKDALLRLSPSQRAVARETGVLPGGCVALGLERWLLAVLATHGVEPRHWPLTLTHDATIRQETTV